MNEITIIVGEQRLVVEPGRIIEIGRGVNSDVRVADPRVSREHLRVSWGPQGWTVDCVGRGGSFVDGHPATKFPLVRSVDVHLVEADGPVVRFEVSAPQEAATQFPEGTISAQPSPDMPSVGSIRDGADGAGRVATPPPGVAAAVAAAPAAPAYLGGAGGAPGAPGGPVPPGGAPPLPPNWGVPAGGPTGAPRAHVSGSELKSAFRMLVPIREFFHDSALRQWLRVLVAVYALVPLILLFVFENSLNLESEGWAYSLYVAPLWAIVFYFLIRPGKFTWLDGLIGAVFVGAELVLIPGITIPWENALAPGTGDHNLLHYIYGVGLAEELTKALPIAIVALVLLHIKRTKLDARMWMFLGCISGLMFGVYEASTNYIPHDFKNIATNLAQTVAKYVQTGHATVGGVAQFITADAALGLPSVIERIFLDGLQHALWVGITAFFIGLGTNYARQRIPLWIFGLLLASTLHGLNDWSLSGEFGTSLWPWIGIQAFSVFLFLGYTASARSIERAVRHNPLFRGESMLYDTSVQGGSPDAQPAPQPS